MADKAGKILPGPLYIEVEYDYEYEAKDKKIVIKQGERYILVKKTNDDWWQVKRDENSKPFYVPAQYVKEVTRKALMPPVKQSGGLPNSSLKLMHSLQRSTENVNKSPELSSFGKSSPVSGLVRDANQNLGPNSSPGQNLGLSLDLAQNNGKLNSELQSPKVSSQYKSLSLGHFTCPELMEIEKTSFSHEQSCDSAGESSEKVHQDSESGDELSSSSTEQVQWIKHVDEQGRPYYYSADGSRSEWELPKYNASPQQQREIIKSRSLDRKLQEPIVLTKWRHSTIVLDTNDKDYPAASKPNCPENESSPSSPKHQATGQEKYGLLNVTKITENGKKVRNLEHSGIFSFVYIVVPRTDSSSIGFTKNWMSSWAVLQGSSLLFTKTQGTGTSWSFCQWGLIPELLLSLFSSWKNALSGRPAVTYVNCDPVSAITKFGVNQSKPEFTVDLRGAVIDWASKDKSSKKNVIELKTRQGTELLIQSDNDVFINEWFKVLSYTISNQTVESDEAFEDDVPDSPGVEKQDKEKDHKDSKKLRSMKISSSIDSSEQKKTKTKLKKFLTRRPTLQAVREKGYIKDQVFGSSLTSLCQRENSSVPKFVKLCIEHVEEHGLDVDGLYRVSGNLAVIQKLRFAVNHDEKLDLNDSKWEDIHVITGALKMFFRELPEPLFTYNHFNDFVNAIKQEPRQRVHAVKDLIKQLPKPNQDTMQILFRHLKRVVENGEKNRMTYQSVAIVFGPTLLKPEKETGNIAVHTVYQNQIVELILLELNSIFGC
ncbi:rho GTPase-activating protein 12 isoform X13 [Trachemys scripta elegans]|uniref:rho GTPase-activating protein 12 isoform X13 n=1 Tax=Trachemys scripta elegans TaxID=31138 RepID=UPI001554631C|nr:rho GTPase-activating protein 12 isoform X13 [Trachemys scripta elegans]